jgi:glutamine amidotransferase
LCCRAKARLATASTTCAASGFERPLLDAVEGGLPLLGICVGMQLLFDASEEMGEHEGLHLIPGAVRRFPDRHA